MVLHLQIQKYSLTLLYLPSESFFSNVVTVRLSALFSVRAVMMKVHKQYK